MLLLIAADGVGGADAGRAEPKHVLMPVPFQNIVRRAQKIRHQGVTHAHDEVQRLARLRLVLRIEQQPILGAGAGIDDLRAGLHGQRLQAGLLHEADEVAEEGGLRNPAALDAMEFAVGQQGDLAGGRDAQPVRIKQAHELAHAGHPQGIEAIDLVAPGHEDVLPPLRGGEGGQQGPPQGFGNRLRPMQLVERMHSPETVARAGEAAQHLRGLGRLGGFKGGEAFQHQGFAVLQFGHVFLPSLRTAAICIRRSSSLNRVHSRTMRPALISCWVMPQICTGRPVGSP